MTKRRPTPNWLNELDIFIVGVPCLIAMAAIAILTVMFLLR